MSKPKNDTANARPKRKKTALIIAIVLLLVALVAAGVLVFRYWSQQNAYQELETYVEVEEDPNVVTQFASDETYQDYIQKMLNRSMVNQEGDVFTADMIKQSFALCTCEYTRNDGRDLLFATVVATTVPNDPFVPCDPDAITGLGKDQSVTFGTDE